MNELQSLELLLDELLKGIQDILLSGEVLSDEFQGMLAKEIEATVSRIDVLKAQSNEPPPIGTIEEEEAVIADQVAPPETDVPSETPPKPPPIGLTKSMPSSNIESFSYDPKTENLYVRFLGEHPNRQGPIYKYDGVPIDIFKIFRKGAVPATTDGKNKWGSWWKGKKPSMGAAMYHLIKAGAYPYQRVS